MPDAPSESTCRQWLDPVFHLPWATTGHLNLDPIKLDDDPAWGLGWGIEINRTIWHRSADQQRLREYLGPMTNAEQIVG